jgi:hypothetical protein
MLDDGQAPDQRADDGLFTLSFGGESLNSGVGELVLNATGPTFVREKRMTYEVVPPVNLLASPRSDGRVLDVSISADVKLIDPASLQIDAWLENTEGEQFRMPLKVAAGQGASGVIDLMSFTGPRQIAVKASAKALSGESIDYFDTPIEVEGMKAPEPVVVEKPKPTPPPIEPEPTPTPTPEPQPEPEDEEEGGWGVALIWFGVINLLLIIGGGGAFWWIRRRNQRNIVSLVDDADATVVSDDKADSATASDEKEEGND